MCETRLEAAERMVTKTGCPKCGGADDPDDLDIQLDIKEARCLAFCFKCEHEWRVRTRKQGRERYTVEFTSSNPTVPRQITVEAEGPEDAVIRALQSGRGEDFVMPYDEDTDPHGNYPGWGYVKVSVELEGF